MSYYNFKILSITINIFQHKLLKAAKPDCWRFISTFWSSELIWLHIYHIPNGNLSIVVYL